MTPRLKPVKNQVLVVTGASSGIALVTATTGLKERGGRAPYVSERSFYTQASLHPMLTGAALAATGLTLASWILRRTEQEPKESSTHPWYEADRRRW